jgi:molybdopterin molybdotransferase
LPAYLDVIGAVSMGAAPEVVVRPGTAVSMPTGGVQPAGADAVVMVEYTQQTIPGTVEVVRPAAPGDGLVGADEDVAVGQLLAPAGRPLRAPDLGMLAAAGVTSFAVHARPVVGICSTGDEVVPPETAELAAGQVRDATAPALAGLVRAAGGVPRSYGIVADDAAELEHVLGRPSLPATSWWSRPARRSAPATRPPGRRAARPAGDPQPRHRHPPGKPTLLAQCGEVPVVGLPGNPLSALVVFRLVGVPLVHRLGGCTRPAPEPNARARLARQVASQAGRLDVVQVRLDHEDGGLVASPLFGASALLSVLTAADGYTVVPEDATGLDAGVEVDVTLYR